MNNREEQIEQARRLIATGISEDLLAVLYQQFPELKESEDERIRKILIHIVKGACDKYGIKYKGDEITEEKLLAYLEKQKEPKLESCDCSRDEESYTNGIHHVLMNPEAYGLIKQKPAEQLGGTFTSYDMAKTFTEGQNYVIAHPEKFGLCKPAEWSEEDERTLESFLGWLQGSMGEKTYSSWLKSLPERFSLKPKQEWSEEDERIICNLIRYFRCKEGLRYGEEKTIDWLKSLRPQPRWKPSEEQMEWLESAVKLSTDKPHIHGIIISLYEQLKRL